MGSVELAWGPQVPIRKMAVNTVAIGVVHLMRSFSLICSLPSSLLVSASLILLRLLIDFRADTASESFVVVLEVEVP